MNAKKKVSILAALALCVTIGGVYATWTYTSDSATIDSQHKHVAQDIAGSTSTGAAGTLKVETAGLKFVIDQADSNHHAKLVWSNTVESIPVTFMPSANASADIKTNGIAVMYYFETSGTWDFGGAVGEDNVYAIPTTKYKVAMTKVDDVDGDGIADFQGTIPKDVFTQSITLKNTLVLDTQSDYEAFKAALDGIKVGVTVAPDDGTAVEFVVSAS